MKMRIFKWALAALCILGSLASCNKDLNMDGADKTTLRMSLTPAPSVISAAGDSFTAAVVVNQGMDQEVPWTVSVDNNPTWIHIELTEIERTFVGTYGGDEAVYKVNGITVTVDPNTTGAKRMANLRFTVPDNSSIVYTLNQAQ